MPGRRPLWWSRFDHLGSGQSVSVNPREQTHASDPARPRCPDAALACADEHRAAGPCPALRASTLQTGRSIRTLSLRPAPARPGGPRPSGLRGDSVRSAPEQRGHRPFGQVAMLHDATGLPDYRPSRSRRPVCVPRNPVHRRASRQGAVMPTAVNALHQARSGVPAATMGRRHRRNSIPFAMLSARRRSASQGGGGVRGEPGRCRSRWRCSGQWSACLRPAGTDPRAPAAPSWMPPAGTEKKAGGC